MENGTPEKPTPPTRPTPPTPPAAPGVVAGSSGRQMILTMGGIGFVCGLLIVLTYQMTFPIIERNKAEALQRAIFEVVPGAATKAMFTLQDGALLVATDDDGAATKYYACYDDAGALVGVAMEAQGQGFQDVLRVLYGYSPQARAIVGLKVLESRETPGLGDKIEKDPKFRANFDALEVEVDAAHQIANPVSFVKRGEKTEAWQVEGITGATISSKAIATILEESTAHTVPVIIDNLATLEEGVR